MSSDLHVEASPVGPVVRPSEHAETVILYLHDNNDPVPGSEPASGLAERLALLAGATVVCCRYGRTFPTALNDVHDAYRYCRDAGQVVVAGERMGAGLAAALLVRLRDRAAPLPDCAVLISALLDLTLQTKSVFLNASADPTVDISELQRRVADYAANNTLTNPLVSPVYANLYGLPPVQLLAAGTDPLLDDSLVFAARAARSHLTVDLRVWENAASLHAERIQAMAGFIAAWHPRARANTSRMIPS